MLFSIKELVLHLRIWWWSHTVLILSSFHVDLILEVCSATTFCSSFHCTNQEDVSNG